MSQPDLNSANNQPSVLVQKPKTTIYTVLLIISAVALLVGCLFLYLEWDRYGTNAKLDHTPYHTLSRSALAQVTTCDPLTRVS